MIDIDSLSKKFSENIVVNKLSLNINKGEIFGLLGPNAAGKTTTIRMLCGLLKPSSGSASIAGIQLGRNSDILKKRIGYTIPH